MTKAIKATKLRESVKPNTKPRKHSKLWTSEIKLASQINEQQENGDKLFNFINSFMLNSLNLL